MDLKCLLSNLPFRFRSYFCIYISLISLTLQLVIFVILMYTLEDKGFSLMSLSSSNQCAISIYEDIKSLTLLGLEIGFSFILLEEQLFNTGRKLSRNVTVNCIPCSVCKPVILAFDTVITADRRKEFLSKVIEQEFVPVTFYNFQPLQVISQLKDVETAIFLQKTATFQIIILYPREDNTLWFGDIQSDSSYYIKLASLNLTLQHIELMKTEGTIERFEMAPIALEEGPDLMIPKDVTSYLSDINQSKFIECNLTRAALFHSQFGSDKSAEAKRFRHKVWKMLSRVKIVLDSLGLMFWLSSGTVLGYFRECDIIAHSKDVDIGMWATSYTDRIITEMRNHGFRLKISLGFPNDSLELSFIDQSDIKLDIFFFYEEDELTYWNGGTQVKSGKKFKYTFPKFTLCWTLFKDLRLRVPCETEDYVHANYGPNWFTPIKSWDWKTSPFNVQPNGLWKTEQMYDAIKMFV